VSTDDHSAEQDQAVLANLFPRIFALIPIGLVACTAWAVGQSNTQLADELSDCWAIADNHVRLVCYDKVSAPRQPAKGALGPLGPNSHEKLQ